jgi:hypothetical protein
MKILSLPPYEKLHEMFTVDKSSPSGLRWKNSSCTRIKPGDVAGTKSDSGYWNVYVISARYKVHRIIFYMQTGKDPGNNFIDHVSRNPSDNFELRLATRSQNAANRVKSLYKNKPTHSEFKGVTWHKTKKKWIAQIIFNKKKTELGAFASELEAAKVYNLAATEFWGEFAVLNIIKPEE